MSTHPTLISEEPAGEIARGTQGKVCDSARLEGREQERRKTDSIMPSRSQRWGWRASSAILRETAVLAGDQGSVPSAGVVVDNQ